jgi:flavodoxin
MKRLADDPVASQTVGSPASAHPEPTMLGRRSFLRLALAAVAGTTIGAAMSACSTTPPARPRASAQTGDEDRPGGSRTILLAYFSRPGENYYYGGRRDLKVGNTQVLADMIAARLDCDVHRIEAADPYSEEYDDTVQRNVREQQTDARPAIADPPPTIDEYDTVLLAGPIWNVRAPMIMSTFADSYDFSGITVFPITTYAMSGPGTTVEDYRRSCTGARIGEGLAVRGEELRNAGASIDAWLLRTRLLVGGARR